MGGHSTHFPNSQIAKYSNTQTSKVPDINKEIFFARAIIKIIAVVTYRNSKTDIQPTPIIIRRKLKLDNIVVWKQNNEN